MNNTPTFLLQKSADRGFFDHGWLKTYHSFSFADYYDPKNMHWGALRVFNDDIVEAQKGFGTHPHKDMEILTYVLEGELTHRDSMGNIRTVKAGGVQYLSAGTGITHSEYNASSTTPCRLVQMWVLPHADGLEPRYGQVDFTAAERENRWLTVAGSAQQQAPIKIWQDATCSVAHIDRGTLSLMLEPGRYAFVFVANGSLEVSNVLTQERWSLQGGDALRLSGEQRLQFTGAAEVVAWDVPQAS